MFVSAPGTGDAPRCGARGSRSGGCAMGMQRFGDSTGCWSGVVLSLLSGEGGTGTPTASTAEWWPHPGGTVTIETGGLEDVAATQPT